MARPFFESLASRFPRFEQLWASWRGSQIPFVPQLTSVECGFACLSMVAGYYGKYVSMEELRNKVTLVPGVGVDAQMMLELARGLGMRGRAVMADYGDLEGLPPGTILHWDLFHFVVLARSTPGFLEVLDPASGRVRVPESQARKGFTGVAVLLEPGEGFQKTTKPTSALTRIMKELLASDAWVPMIIASLLLQALAFSLPALTAIVLERVLPLDDRGALSLLWVMCLLVGSLYLVAQLVRTRLSTWLVMKAGAQLRLSMIERVLGARMKFFFERSPQEVAEATSSIDAVMSMVSTTMLSGAIDSVLALTFVALIVAADLTLGGVVVLVAAAEFGLVTLGYKLRIDLEAEWAFQVRRQALLSAEAMHGVEAVKALGLERRILTAIMNQQVDSLKAQARARNMSATMEALHGAFRFVGPLVVLLVGSGRALDGSISFGQLFSLAALAGAALSPVGELASALSNLPRLRAMMLLLTDIVEAPQETVGGTESVSLSGSIRLEDVTFRYSPMSPPAIQDINLEIRPGEFVGIIGPSGSGKSTLASLLVGLLTPDSGRVEFDGQDLKNLDLFAVRAQIGFVPQRAFLFSQNVRDNITAQDPTIPIDRVIAAAKTAAIHDDIVRLSLGYETLISNFAVFSGGQRQRLNLARALVRNPKIVILDEATSAVDSITERVIQENVEALKATRIVIAHRLSTVRKADRLVLMSEGHIIDVGTWRELSQRQALFREIAQKAPE